MNNREVKIKTSKNQLKEIVEERIASSKKPKAKKVISPEKLAAKEAGYEAFLQKKAQRKLLKKK